MLLFLIVFQNIVNDELLIFQGVGTLAFDARLGLYEDPPKEEAMRFIQAVHDFFSLSHELFFSLSRRIAKHFDFDTPKVKKFFKTADILIETGEGFVDKKMRELKEMADNGIDPSGNTQGMDNFLLYRILCYRL